MSSTILITGSTGLVGKALVKMCLSQGHIVHYLTTQKSKIILTENCKGFFWNPQVDLIDICCFEGVEVVINLAGSSIAQRWTNTAKSSILSSRKQALELLYSIIKENKFQIKHIISASAIGIYPDSLSNYYEETDSEGDATFLSEVVQKWETAVDAFSDLNIRVAKIRIGLVLSDKGGALPELTKPIKFGLGAAFGSGKSWQSWIHIKDLAGLFMYVMTHNLEGAFNAVAPNPVTNLDLTKLCAKVLSKPLWLPNIPKFFMKLVLGDMHTLLFLSQRVSSKKIEEAGFNFKYHHLQPALEALLK